MKGIFTEYSQELDAELRGLGFTGDLNFADCAATLLPWAEALEQPFRIVFAGPAAGTISSARLGDAIGDGNLLCADVGGTSTMLVDRRWPAVREQHVRARARPHHQCTLRRDLERRCRGEAASLRSRRPATSRWGPAAQAQVPGPACYGRGGTDPTVSDACLLMGILDPDGFAAGAMRLDADLARRAFEALPTPLRFEDRVGYSFRIAVANIAEEVTNVAVRPA